MNAYYTLSMNSLLNDTVMDIIEPFIPFFVLFVTLGPIYFLISKIYSYNERKKEEQFKKHILPKLDVIHKNQRTTFEHRIDSTNALSDRQSIHAQKLKTTVSLTENEILLHNNFSEMFMSPREYKAPVILYKDLEHLNPLLMELNAFKILSINLNSFGDCTHIEAQHKESETATVSVRIKALTEDTKKIISDHFIAS